MKKEMLINVMQPEECRIAILEDNVLEELYVERTSQESYVGNIYKGRIVNIEPSIQAAFVDFGIGRNGFLHVSDVEPTYYRHLETRESGRDRDRGGRGRDAGRGGDRGGRDRGGRDSGRGRRPPEGGARRGGGRRSSSRDFEPLDIEADLNQLEAEIAQDPTYSPPVPREEAPFDEPPIEEAADRAAEPRDEGEPPPDERPRYMDSAERRTEKDRHRPETPVSDDEIFFPRSGDPAPAAPAARHVEPEPADEPEPILPTSVERVVGEFEEDAPRREEPRRGRHERPAPPRDETPATEPDEELDDEPAPAAFDDDFDDELHEERTFHSDAEGEGDDGPPRRERGNGRGGRGRSGGGDRDRRRGPPRGGPGFGRPKPLIQDIFKRGQEVIVQVIKEGIGTKGPTLSTYISIAGRYLVLMPGLNRVGVSRKIADDEARRRLRDIFHELQPPKGLGFIIRTAGMDRTKKELQRDLAYLARLYQVIARRIKKIKAPAEIYQESDMITRTIRDTFSSDIDTIYVDEPAAFEQAQEFMQVVMPRYANRIKLYDNPEPIFYKYGIEDEIIRIQQRHVPLPAGGSIVIDQTEACVAIDVNSGNFRADNNAEETAYQMNLLAAKEIARQLRLRDLGGVIVNDFIDMREEKHRRGVEKAMRDAVKRDRARTKILKISQFGIIEMTRQRIRPSLKRSIYQECAHCRSTGQVKTIESMSIDVMRMIQLAAHRELIARVQIKVAEEVANYLQNKKRKEVARLEEAGEITVNIHGVSGVAPETLEFLCYDNNNNEIKFLHVEETRPRRR